jgi:hypothetical protein
VDSDALADALSRFGVTVAERRVVARQARDLADAGLVERHRGHALTVETVVSELAEAPDGGPADRWNWWVGALDVAYGGFAGFGVRQYERED